MINIFHKNNFRVYVFNKMAIILAIFYFVVVLLKFLCYYWGMENRICIGKIVKPVGLKGSVKVIPNTENTNRFKKLKEVYIENELCKVKSVSVAGQEKVLITFENFENIEKAETLRDKNLYVERENAIELKPGEFFAVDLMGAKIYNQSDEYVGTITDIENYGANDILTFHNTGTVYTMAVVENLFVSFNVESKKLIVSEKYREVMCEI